MAHRKSGLMFKGRSHKGGKGKGKGKKGYIKVAKKGPRKV